METGKRTLRGGLLKSRSILIRLGWFYLVCGWFLAVNGEVRAAQQVDRVVEKAVIGSSIHLVQADEGESNNPSPTETADDTEQYEAWLPPTPIPEKYDWIQLVSGEWLKGELKMLYEKNLEFDSDKLDLLEFKWKDVKQVRSPRYFSIRFEGPVTVVGILQVTEDKVYVTVGKERQTFERNQLIAIAPGRPKESNYWSGKLDLGINYSQGNTNQAQYTTIGNIQDALQHRV